MPVRGCNSRGSDARGVPLPEAKNRRILGAARSCPLLPQRSLNLATQGVISFQFLPTKGPMQTSRGWISILAPSGSGTIMTLNPGTFGTVTSVSQPVSVIRRKGFIWDVPYSSVPVPWSVPIRSRCHRGPIDGQRVPDDFGITLSLMSRPLPSLRVSLLLLCWRNSSLVPRPSKPPLDAILLEQCRQCSLDFEDR